MTEERQNQLRQDIEDGFGKAVRAAFANKELLEQYDRLRGARISRFASLESLEAALSGSSDQAKREVLEFLEFVRDHIFMPVVDGRAKMPAREAQDGDPSNTKS